MTTTPTASPELPDLDTENLESWPERIWLQHGCDEVPSYADASGVFDGITWCEDNINPLDVEYVRADMARRAQPEGEAPQAETAWAITPPAFPKFSPDGLESSMSPSDLWDYACLVGFRCAIPANFAMESGLAAQSQGAQAARDDVLEEAARQCEDIYSWRGAFNAGLLHTSNLKACAAAIRALKDSAALAAKAEAPAHETIVQQADELVCTACGTSAQHAESGAQAVPRWVDALPAERAYADPRTKREEAMCAEIEAWRNLAAQSQGAQPSELCIGFANNDQGVHVNVMQRHADGTIIVLHQGRVPAGDSFTRFALAAKAEAPAHDVLGEQRWSKEAEMLESWSKPAAQQAAAPGATIDTREFRELLAKAMDAAELATRTGNPHRDYKPARDALVAHIDSRIAPSAPGTPEAPADELERLRALLNTPELHDFGKGVVLEAAHQRERWSTSHDAGKEPADWFWLIGYLGGKALKAHIDGNTEKALHHTISTAAACANWHAAVLGKTTMRPGIEPPADVAAQLDGGQGEGVAASSVAAVPECPHCVGGYDASGYRCLSCPAGSSSEGADHG